MRRVDAQSFRACCCPQPPPPALPSLFSNTTLLALSQSARTARSTSRCSVSGVTLPPSSLSLSSFAPARLFTAAPIVIDLRRRQPPLPLSPSHLPSQPASYQTTPYGASHALDSVFARWGGRGRLACRPPRPRARALWANRRSACSRTSTTNDPRPARRQPTRPCPNGCCDPRHDPVQSDQDSGLPTPSELEHQQLVALVPSALALAPHYPPPPPHPPVDD